MPIKIDYIPAGYKVRKWGHIGNKELWWNDASMAYLERRLLLRYSPSVAHNHWLVYHDKKQSKYTIIERSGGQR